MAWKFEFTPAAQRQLAKLDPQNARRIAQYLNDIASNYSDPRQRGKGITDNLSGLWRYRVGDYRVICEIQADR